MKILQDIKPITYLKSKTSELIKQINETHRPVIITQNGEPKAVLQNPYSYDKMPNAIGILNPIALAEEDIKAERIRPQNVVFDVIERKLKGK